MLVPVAIQAILMGSGLILFKKAHRILLRYMTGIARQLAMCAFQCIGRLIVVEIGNLPTIHVVTAQAILVQFSTVLVLVTAQAILIQT